MGVLEKLGAQGELLKKFAAAEKVFKDNYDPTESVTAPGREES